MHVMYRRSESPQRPARWFLADLSPTAVVHSERMNFGLIATWAFVLVLFCALMGFTFSERWLEVRAKRQVELQRSLNKQWQETRVARQK